jgi:hypothetical protein
MSGVWMLLQIHLMIVLWLICFFTLLATAAVLIYLIFHYLYTGEKIVFHRFHGALKHK